MFIDNKNGYTHFDIRKPYWTPRGPIFGNVKHSTYPNSDLTNLSKYDYSSSRINAHFMFPLIPEDRKSIQMFFLM